MKMFLALLGLTATPALAADLDYQYHEHVYQQQPVLVDPPIPVPAVVVPPVPPIIVEQEPRCTTGRVTEYDDILETSDWTEKEICD